MEWDEHKDRGIFSVRLERPEKIPLFPLPNNIPQLL
jgi:hypothetical protein